MIKICAWCGVEMGTIEHFDSDAITHGICKKCLNLEIKKFMEVRKK